MDHDLPWFRFAHAVHSDVKPALVFFNNCRLTNVNLSQFENKHFHGGNTNFAIFAGDRDGTA